MCTFLNEKVGDCEKRIGVFVKSEHEARESTPRTQDSEDTGAQTVQTTGAKNTDLEHVGAFGCEDEAKAKA